MPKEKDKDKDGKDKDGKGKDGEKKKDVEAAEGGEEERGGRCDRSRIPVSFTKSCLAAVEAYAAFIIFTATSMPLHIDL